MLKRLVQLAIIASAVLALNAHAAFDMFLKIDGVDGEAQDDVGGASHKDEIEVLAWSWGMSTPGSFQGGGGAIAGKASFQDLSVTKHLDLSTTELMRAVALGRLGVGGRTATLTVRSVGLDPEDPMIEVLVITMENVLVTSVSTGGSGGEDRLTENITLTFASYCVKYTPILDTGAAGTSKQTCYSIEENRSLD